MGRCYSDTGGNVDYSGSTDSNSVTYTVTVHATYGGGTTIPIIETPDLSALSLSGATQDSINFPDATNTNQDIFWITAVDNVSTPKTITVNVAPTGLTVAVSIGNIGGRILFAGITGEESFLRPGDEIIVNNSPAAIAGSFFTSRVAGTITGGFVKLRGKAGVRPVFNTTGTASPIDGNSADMLWLENLEIDQDGATGNAINNLGANSVCKNVRVVDCGGIGIDVNEDNVKIIGCEITGCGGDGIDTSTLTFIHIIGCYIHDNGGHGIDSAATVWRSIVLFCVIDTNTSSGINLSGAPSAIGSSWLLANSTIYGNGIDGLNVADADHNITMINNIFLDNGNTGTEYNVDWPADFDLCNFADWNIFNQGGGLGGTNLNNYTVHDNDLTSAPDISTSTFLPSTTSPAKASGMPGPIPVTGSAVITGYLDRGAMQRQEAASGGGLMTHPGMGGGLRG